MYEKRLLFFLFFILIFLVLKRIPTLYGDDDLMGLVCLRSNGYTTLHSRFQRPGSFKLNYIHQIYLEVKCYSLKLCSKKILIVMVLIIPVAYYLAQFLIICPLKLLFLKMCLFIKTLEKLKIRRKCLLNIYIFFLKTYYV